MASRNVLKHIIKLYEEAGLRAEVAPEVEFFLVHKNTDPDYELMPPKGRSGRREVARMSFSIDAVAEFEDFVEDMYDFADEQALSVDTLIHENGAAQLEINFNHGDPLDMADQVFVFKRTVRETAQRHNMYATFMAKPMQKEPGSALTFIKAFCRWRQAIIFLMVQTTSQPPNSCIISQGCSGTRPT